MSKKTEGRLQQEISTSFPCHWFIYDHLMTINFHLIFNILHHTPACLSTLEKVFFLLCLISLLIKLSCLNDLWMEGFLPVDEWKQHFPEVSTFHLVGRRAAFAVFGENESLELHSLQRLVHYYPVLKQPMRQQRLWDLE